MNVTISAADISTPLSEDLTLEPISGTYNGLITQIPAGLNRLFTATAYDSAGAVAYQGTAVAEIDPGDRGRLDRDAAGEPAAAARSHRADHPVDHRLQ